MVAFRLFAVFCLSVIGQALSAPSKPLQPSPDPLTWPETVPLLTMQAKRDLHPVIEVDKNSGTSYWARFCVPLTERCATVSLGKGNSHDIEAVEKMFGDYFEGQRTQGKDKAIEVRWTAVCTGSKTDCVVRPGQVLQGEDLKDFARNFRRRPRTG